MQTVSFRIAIHFAITQPLNPVFGVAHEFMVLNPDPLWLVTAIKNDNHTVTNGLMCIGQYFVTRQQRPSFAVPQCGVPFSKGDTLPVPIQEVVIPVRRIPRKRSTTIRIMAASQTNFVAIIDARRSGKSA